MKQKEFISTRINWIDYLKAFSILLVVIGHLPISYELKKYIYSFHLPLFFILSGITFKPDKYKDLKELMIKKAKGLLLPYLMLNISYFVIWTIFYKILGNSEITLFEIIKGIIFANNDKIFLLNGPTWFIPTLFLVEVFSYIFYKFSSGNKKEIIYISIISLIFGYIENVAKKNFFMPWHLNSVPVAIFFFFSGYLFFDYYKNNKEKIEKTKLIYGVLCIILGLYFALRNGRVSFGGNHYHSMIYTLLSCYLSIIGYSIFIIKIKECKFLSYIGANTLFILGFHNAIEIIINYLKPEMLSRTRYSILVGIGSVLVLTLISYLVNKFIPFVVGKIEKKKSNLIGLGAYIILTIIFIFMYY